jgi:hypothetical protein
MSEREAQDLSPEQERARKAIRSLPLVEAEPGFRERLKADFVAGRLGGAESPQGGGRPGRERRGFRLGWLLVPAALAVVVFVAAAIFNRGPAPKLADVIGDGTVTVDGQTFATAERVPMAQAIQTGSSLETSEGVDVDLMYGRTMAVRLMSGVATIPAAPARWFGKKQQCWLDSGELDVLTGPDFRGGELVIATADGTIEITGTIVSVYCDTSLTCVCVLEGTASVGVDAADMEPVPAGKRKVMFSDGRAPLVTDIAPAHRDHMIEFEKKYAKVLRPSP